MGNSDKICCVLDPRGRKMKKPYCLASKSSKSSSKDRHLKVQFQFFMSSDIYERLKGNGRWGERERTVGDVRKVFREEVICNLDWF